MAEELNFNNDVTVFLDALNHPFRAEIEALRHCILSVNQDITENIKWNAPNYALAKEDRITMRITPQKPIQLIFHCGAKVQTQPESKILEQDFGLLVWRANDRAVATFKNIDDIEYHKISLNNMISNWLSLTI